MDTELTPQEIERMRAIVAGHDRTQGKVNQFDLNAPPQVEVRYTPFPRMLYNHSARTFAIVQNEAQLEEHLAAGWSKEPYPQDPPEPVQLDAASAAEAEAVQAALKKKK
jgi:hypothetical protein